MKDEPINTRKVRHARHLLLALLTQGFLSGVLPAAQATSYTFTNVSFPGAHYTVAWGINAHGQIVGATYVDSTGGHGFLATPHKKARLWAPFIAVLLLATIGLLVLSRVRLSVIPAETASGGPAVAEPSAWAPAAGRTEPPGRYARLVRQSPIATVPQEIVFEQEELLIGSGAECNIILRHPSIAPQHARVTWRQQGYVLRAVHGGKQSTFVNGRPIEENLLKEGWVVRLGEVEFIFYTANCHV